MFAFNTERTNYVLIAERAAKIARHVLGLPVALVTEHGTEAVGFDHVVYVDNKLKNFKVGVEGSWRNGDRWRAFDLSPFDETLLIDSDYLMLDQSLLKLFEQDFDYRIITHNDKPSGLWQINMGMFSLPYHWATAVLFRKTEKARLLFNLVGRVQRNYDYYRRLYHMREGNFRNDYAFTIAGNMLNGYDQGMDKGIPWHMLTFADVVTSINLTNGMLTVKEKDKGYVIPRQCIHVMDKGYLLSDNFAELVEAVCQE